MYDPGPLSPFSRAMDDLQRGPRPLFHTLFLSLRRVRVLGVG